MATKRTRKSWTAAAIQMTSTTDVDRNVALATRLVRKAAGAGADLVALPENFSYLRSEGSKVQFRTSLDGDLVTSMGALARELRCHLLLGSIPESRPRGKKIHNTSVLLGPDGAIHTIYRKIHLFDVKIRGRVDLQESKTVARGADPVVADTVLGPLGLTICYDLRFPELYRRLVAMGAEVLFVPAAFTAYTGPPHWLPLLRARAIENQCWVVAPAQVGRHSHDRESHGETVIVDPWGTVAARLPRRQGFIKAVIDRKQVATVRRGLPCLEHVQL
jgi:predicted amidohydrolase